MKNEYMSLYANCVLVEGVAMSLIIDLQRCMVYRFDSHFVKYINNLGLTSFETLLSVSSMEDKLIYNELKKFLIDNELGFLTSHLESFPPINFEWMSSKSIESGIIDIDHSTDHVFLSLEKLANICATNIQLRFFSKIDNQKLQDIALYISKYDFYSSEIIIQYTEYLSVEFLKSLFGQCNSLYVIIIAGAPFNETIEYGREDVKIMHICYTTQVINNERVCGIINEKSFIIPSISKYCERLSCNSCLSRKISVDRNGLVRNCPSMPNNFGHIANAILSEIVITDEFLKYTMISKDTIDVCSDCEYRFLCVDCRAYTIDGVSLTSKPLKCTYDPYLAIWNT